MKSLSMLYIGKRWVEMNSCQVPCRGERSYASGILDFASEQQQLTGRCRRQIRFQALFP